MEIGFEDDLLAVVGLEVASAESDSIEISLEASFKYSTGRDEVVGSSGSGSGSASSSSGFSSGAEMITPSARRIASPLSA